MHLILFVFGDVAEHTGETKYCIEHNLKRSAIDRTDQGSDHPC